MHDCGGEDKKITSKVNFKMHFAQIYTFLLFVSCLLDHPAAM